MPIDPDGEHARARAIADALRMLIVRAETEGLPAVALTLRLALADIEVDIGETE
jgi:hypothetical protein